MKRNKKLFIGLGVMIMLIVAYLIGNRPPKLNEKEILDSSIIEYPSKFNYRQTINDCGPFNVAAIVRALKNEVVDSKDFAETIEWRLPNKYTLPQGLKKQLEENGLEVETPHVKTLTDEEKINYLQQTLSQNKPIIILGERDDYVSSSYEHYITLFGFDREKNEFYAYDPFYPKSTEGMTIDNNGSLPGNRTYSSDELLDFWRGGGMFGLYVWYIMVASVDET